MDYLELDKIRVKMGWSKRELAKRLGVGERTIHGYIRNEKEIPVPVAKLLKIYSGGYVENEE